jgi:glycosyltransferase involved in cell wall biosynthesis
MLKMVNFVRPGKTGLNAGKNHVSLFKDMTKETKFYQTDILLWANLHPEKMGSFEDYICHLSLACLKSGLEIKFVLGDEISQSILTLFLKYKVNFHLLTESEITSKWSMFKIMRATRPRLLHLHFIGNGYMMNTVSHMMGSKIIVTDHSSVSLNNNPKVNMWRSLKNLKRHFVLRSVDHFIAVSNYVAERLYRNNGISRKKITTIYNGIDLERFKPFENKTEKVEFMKKIFQIDNEKFVVAFIGQLIEEKGVHVLLDVIHRLSKKHDDIIFVIVGAGMLESHIRRFIKQTGNSRIMFLGQRDDIEVITKICDLVVVPSIWEEAFGLVIAEASACGIPVIGSRIGGIPEVIINGKTGLLTTPGDVNELAEAIGRLLTDGELYKRLSSAGREHVHNNFNLQNMVNRTVTLYKRYA